MKDKLSTEAEEEARTKDQVSSGRSDESDDDDEDEEESESDLGMTLSVYQHVIPSFFFLGFCFSEVWTCMFFFAFLLAINIDHVWRASSAHRN
jgi:hypothetical protein